MGRLTICRASAGTGKTWSICDRIVEHVIERDLDPARILATTFTLKAAAELKARIQARLMSEPSLSASRRAYLSERLDLANIGTVDAVALTILERYALDLGLSAELRVCDEAAGRRTLVELVEQLDPQPWADLHFAARPLQINDVTALVLSLLEIQRTNGIPLAAFRDQLIENAEEMIGILAPDGPLPGITAAPRVDELARNIHDAMRELPDGTKVTASAVDDLRRLSLKREPTWQELMRLSNLKAGKRSGADALLTPLRAAVGAVRRHPKLHADLRTFVGLAADLTVQLGERYQRYKAERGLLDFRDLEIEVLRLLADEPVARQLASEVDLLVVDEFQDTDPVQLAIFLRLRRLIQESYWVGDEKQAIYGFRGTDARLTRAVWESSDGDPAIERSQLDVCYRSLPRIVDCVRGLFASEFGASVEVECGREVENDDHGSVERWLLEGSSRDDEAKALARGIEELISEGAGAGDIAVLVKTNREARTIGHALSERGIASVLELPGVSSTREAILAVAGLRVLADRWDSLAAATLVHHMPGEEESVEADGSPSWLGARLFELDAAQSRVAPLAGHPILESIERLRPQARLATPREALAAVIEALRLPERVASCGEPSRRLANLDALLDLAGSYEQLERDAARPATITGLIGHFRELAEREDDVATPPSGLSAVSVVTYHAAKGLEWPIVVLSSLDREPPTDLWRPEAIGGVDVSGRDPLADRRVRYWPWPFGKSRYGRGGRSSSDGFEDDALGTEAGRAARAEQEAELRRLLYVGVTRARDRVIFAHRPKATRWLDRLSNAQAWLDEHADRVRTLTTIGDVTDGPSRTEWIAPAPVRTEERSPATHSPSGVPTIADDESPTTERHSFEATKIGARVVASEELPDDLPHDQIGNAFHRYFASLPATRDLDDSAREDIASRCLAVELGAAGLADDSPLSARELVDTGELFRTWVEERFPNAEWYTETPLTAPHRHGGRWSGTADLLLALPNGDHVLIDHKSAATGEKAWVALAQRYAAQLDAYAEILAHQQVPVRERWLHLPRSGAMIEVRTRDDRADGDGRPESWVQSELF